MDGTLRQQAYLIEQEARTYDPATAINLLSVRVAQLEARLAGQVARAESAERELASLSRTCTCGTFPAPTDGVLPFVIEHGTLG